MQPLALSGTLTPLSSTLKFLSSPLEVQTHCCLCTSHPSKPGKGQLVSSYPDSLAKYSSKWIYLIQVTLPHNGEKGNGLE